MPKQRINPKTKYRNSRQEKNRHSVIAKHTDIPRIYGLSRLRHRTHKICFEAQVIATKYHGTFASQSSKHTRHEVLHLHREKSPFRNASAKHTRI